MGVVRVDLYLGQTLAFDDGRVVIALESKSGSRARLKISTEEDVQMSWGSEQKKPTPPISLSRPMPKQ